MKGVTWWRVLLLLATAGTVCFIFSRSLRPPAESSAESESVKKILVAFLGGEETFLGGFVSHYVRKIAHFTEFFLLGVEATFLFSGAPARKFFLLQPGFGLLIAATDETIQRFTGRGASVRDVLLDFSGFLTATLLIRFAGWLLARRRTDPQDRKKKG